MANLAAEIKNAVPLAQSSKSFIEQEQHLIRDWSLSYQTQTFSQTRVRAIYDFAAFNIPGVRISISYGFGFDSTSYFLANMAR